MELQTYIDNMSEYKLTKIKANKPNFVSNWDSNLIR